MLTRVSYPDPVVLKEILRIYQLKKSEDKKTTLGWLKEATTNVASFVVPDDYLPTGSKQSALLEKLDTQFDKMNSPQDIVAICLSLGDEADKIPTTYNYSRALETLHAARWYILKKIPHFAEKIKALQQGQTPVAEDPILECFIIAINDIKHALEHLTKIANDLRPYDLQNSVHDGIADGIRLLKRRLAFLGYNSFKDQSDEIQAAFPREKYKYPDKKEITRFSNYPFILHENFLTRFLQNNIDSIKEQHVIEEFEKQARHKHALNHNPHYEMPETSPLSTSATVANTLGIPPHSLTQTVEHPAIAEEKQIQDEKIPPATATPSQKQSVTPDTPISPRQSR